MNGMRGASLLAEVEEMSLDEILHSVRASLSPHARKLNHPPPIPLPESHPLAELPSLMNRQFRETGSSTLTLCGRPLALLYALVAALAGPPNEYVVLVVDASRRFDESQLQCGGPEGLERVFTFRTLPLPPLPPSTKDGACDGDDGTGADAPLLRQAVDYAKKWVLSAPHGQRHRDFWGTIVLTGGADPGGTGAEVVVSRRGWLRVEPAWADTEGFPLGEMDRRQPRKQHGGWVATSTWGAFKFGNVAEGQTAGQEAVAVRGGERGEGKQEKQEDGRMDQDREAKPEKEEGGR